MKLHRTVEGIWVEEDGGYYRVPGPVTWDSLINRDGLTGHLQEVVSRGAAETRVDGGILAPVDGQEVWAAGVTYLRSRVARNEESQGTAARSVYDAVYEAERPELFFKASPWRVCGPGQPVRIRRDAAWSVPEPELAVCVNRAGAIVGYTIGNDMSARDIEGENPLYLPQAKIYDGACALGPALLVGADPLPSDTEIAMAIRRDGREVFSGSTTLAQMRRTPEELVQFLYRETSFPRGCVLLTGTGVVPPGDFTLRAGDEIAIRIAPVGTLINTVDGSS